MTNQTNPCLDIDTGGTLENYRATAFAEARRVDELFEQNKDLYRRLLEGVLLIKSLKEEIGILETKLAKATYDEAN